LFDIKRECKNAIHFDEIMMILIIFW